MSLGDLEAAESFPQGLSAHLPGCRACRELLDKLRRLEAAVRGLPDPPQSVSAKANFLRKVQPFKAAAASPAVPGKRAIRFPARRLAAAAAVIVGLGFLALWLTIGDGSRAQAASSPLPAMVAWNVELSRTRDPNERQRSYSARAEEFAQACRSAKLSTQDRELADALLAHAAWLASHDDPLEEADRFIALAEKILNRIATPAGPTTEQQTSDLARQYDCLVEQGIAGNLDKAAWGALTPEQQGRWQSVADRSAKHLQHMQQVLKQVPPGASKHIEHAIEVQSSPPGRGRGKAPPGQVKKQLRTSSRPDEE
jgi:hypothetical protein